MCAVTTPLLNLFGEAVTVAVDKSVTVGIWRTNNGKVPLEEEQGSGGVIISLTLLGLGTAV